MTTARRTVALLLAALAVGCSPAADVPGPSTDAPGSSPVSAAPAGPATVLTFTEDAAAAAAGTVTPEAGGSIVARAASGATFRLEAPPGAVALRTEIRLIPLADVGGLEAAGPIDAVQMEPDGLQFLAPVQLTIEPSRPIPPERQTMFEANGDGSEVRLALTDPAAAEVVLLFDHFTIGGVASQSSEQRAAMMAKSAQNAAGRIGGEIRNRIARERERQLKGDSDEDSQPDLGDLVDEYRREVLEPLRAAALASCDHLQTYIYTLIGFQRQVELLGLAPDGSYAAMLDEVRGMLDQRYEQCLEEAIAKCKATRDPGVLIRFWASGEVVGASRQAPVDAEARRQADRICDPKSFLLEISRSGIPLRTPTIATSRTADLAGRVRACPRNDGSLELGGQATLTYSDGGAPSSYTLLDLSGSQPASAFVLMLSDVDTVDAHRQLYPPDMDISAVAVSDPVGNAAAVLSLYNGLEEHVGDFDLAVVPVDPDC